MATNSCQGCTKRKVGCHGTCKEYKELLEEHHRIKAEAKKKRKSFMTISINKGENYEKTHYRIRTKVNQQWLETYSKDL